MAARISVAKSSGLTHSVVVLAFVLTVVLSVPQAVGVQSNQNGRLETIRRVAQQWLAVGIKQYQKCFFETAQQSFQHAGEYNQYLTTSERQSLKEYSEKIELALYERKKLFEHIEMAEKLIGQDQILKAKAHMQKSRNDKFLTQHEYRQLTEKLKQLDELFEQRKKEALEYYNHHVQLYEDGHLQKARRGFIELTHNAFLSAANGKRPEDYLMKIDNALGLEVKQPSKTLVDTTVHQKTDLTAIEEEEIAQIDLTAIEEEEIAQIDLTAIEEEEIAHVVRNPENILIEPSNVPLQVDDLQSSTAEDKNEADGLKQSYARAMVKNTITKAHKLVDEGRYYHAGQAVEEAREAIKSNKSYLQEQLRLQYERQLRQLEKKITELRTQWLGKQAAGGL